MVTINISSLFSILGGTLGVVSLFAVFTMSRAIKQWQARCETAEANVGAMRRELELMASISVRTGRRVKQIEHEYSDVADRVDSVELRGIAQSFDQAIESARRGADPVGLSRQFGLSRGEVRADESRPRITHATRWTRSRRRPARDLGAARFMPASANGIFLGTFRQGRSLAP